MAAAMAVVFVAVAFFPQKHNRIFWRFNFCLFLVQGKWTV
jgi:hypothetical protein